MVPRHQPPTDANYTPNDAHQRPTLLPNTAHQPAMSLPNDTRARCHVITADDTNTAYIEHHHHCITTEWKRQDVGMVGKAGQGERMRGEGGGAQ